VKSVIRNFSKIVSLAPEVLYTKKQKMPIKIGDTVTVISGFHKNETGEIIKINKKQEKF
jgi:transcription antitermination factor NusG